MKALVSNQWLMVECPTRPEAIMLARLLLAAVGRVPLRLVALVTENGMPVFQTKRPLACQG